MRYIFTFLSIIAIAASVVAQDINFELKNTEIYKYKSKDKTIDIKLIGSDDNYFYYDFIPYYDYFGEGGGNNVSHLLGKLNRKDRSFSKERIDVESKDDAHKVQGIYYVNEQIVLIRERYNKATNRTKLIAQRINKKTLQLEENQKKMFEISLDSCLYYHRAEYDIKLSKDRSKFLVFYTLLDKNNRAFRIGIRVYNNDLNILWSNDNIKPKGVKGMFEYKNFKIANNGDVFILGKISQSADANYLEGGEGYLKLSLGEFYYIQTPGFKYQIYKYSMGNRGGNYVNLEIPNKAIRNVNYHISNNDVYAYGVYSKNGTISTVGSFIFEIDFSTTSIKNLNISSFNTALFASGLDKSDTRKYNNHIKNNQEWDPYNYKIGELKTRANGDKYFIAEQWLESSATLNTKVFTMYYYRDFYVVSLNSNFVIKGANKIVKRQYTSLYTSRSSCLDFEANGKLYFAFNSIFRNKGGVSKYDKSYLVSLDNSGIQKQVVINTKLNAKTPLILPLTQLKLDNSSILFANMAMKNDAFMFSKLKVR